MVRDIEDTPSNTPTLAQNGLFGASGVLGRQWTKLSEIERLRAATKQSNAELMRPQKLIMAQLRELRAKQDAAIETPEWAFQIQRDGSDKMIGVVAKPLGGKQGA